MIMDDVRVNIEKGSFSETDAAYYISLIKKSKPQYTLKKVTFTKTDDYLDVRYAFQEIPFERIRRISFTDEGRKAVNR